MLRSLGWPSQGGSKLVLKHMQVRKTQVMNQKMNVLAMLCFRNQRTIGFLSYCSITYYNLSNHSSPAQFYASNKLICARTTSITIYTDDSLIARVVWWRDNELWRQFKYNILAMQLIAMKGFKSYEDQLINNLSPHINVILGRNGQGKSNFFKAINFVLTDRVPFNKSEFNAYTHRALDNAVQPVTVQTYFRNQPKAGESSLFRIERIWHPDLREELRVEEHSYNKEEFEHYLQSIGITYSNSYHIVQQGRIDHLTRMDDFQLYQLLEDATGLQKYQRRHEEATHLLQRTAMQKEQILAMLEDIENKLKSYEARKEEYELHNYEELAQKLRSKQDCEQHLRINTEKLQDLKQQEGRLADDLARLRMRAKRAREELEQLQQEITVNQKQLYDCQGNPEDEDIQQIPAASQQLQDINIRLKRVAEGKQRLKAQWERKSKQAETARKDMEAYKARLSALTSQIEGEKLAKSGKGKAEVKAAIDRLQQNIRETDQDIRKMSAYLKDFKVQAGSKQVEQAASLKEKLNTVGLELKTAKIKMFEENRIKNQLESQVEALEQQSSAYQGRLRKALPLLDLSLLRELRRQKISGVYGYLLEFVQLDPSVSFAYELAGVGKLCTLLVQKEDVCEKVIEVNRKLKGRQVNMLPLSLVSRQATEKHNYPAIPDCYSLINEDWIRIRSHPYGENFDKLLWKVLKNAFGKYMLVKTYELALDLSKRYPLNCITADRELVYSEGYFCKVGRDETQEDKLELYYKHAERQKLIADAQAKLIDSGKQLQAIQNVELELNKKKTVLENESTVVTRKLDQIAYQKRAVSKVQEQLENLQRKRGGFQSELKRNKEVMTVIETKKIQSVNPKDFKELEEQCNERAQAYNKRSEEEYTIERQLTALAREEEELSQQANKLKRETDFNKSFSTKYVNQREYRQQLEAELRRRQERAVQLQKELFQVEEEVMEKQTADGEALAQVALLSEEVAYYQARIKDVGEIDLNLSEVEERSNQLSMSMSHMHSKKRHFYTAKEKIFFAKIDLHRQQLADKRNQFQQLQQAEKILEEMLDQCKKEKDREIAKTFEQFQRQFETIFHEVTGGRTDVRLKKNQEREKSRSVFKFRSAISIQVAFEADREVTRRWGEFSGGQKSVLAFCVLMALQKCEPAPFYVLDEIDAALDPVYLQRIVKLIRSESQHSQYFITSFKQEMLEFPDEICNYYLVEMQDRVSKIRRIDQDEAKRTLVNLTS